MGETEFRRGWVQGELSMSTGGHEIDGLWLDDEAQTESLRAIADLFAGRGIRLKLESDPHKVLELLSRRPDAVGCVMLDLDLGPEMDGLEVLEIIRRLVPDMPVLIVSGFADVPQWADGISRLSPRPPVVVKPIPMSTTPEFAEIAERIRRAGEGRLSRNSQANEGRAHEEDAVAVFPSDRVVCALLGLKDEQVTETVMADLAEHVRETFRLVVMNYVLDEAVEASPVRLGSNYQLENALLLAIVRSVPVDLRTFSDLMPVLWREAEIAVAQGELSGAWGRVELIEGALLGVPSEKQRGNP